MKMLKPRFLILDELDSGLDVDSLKTVCQVTNQYILDSHASVLLITHHNKILDFIKPDYIHILINGKIVKTGDFSLARIIEENGYKSFESSESIQEEETLYE